MPKAVPKRKTPPKPFIVPRKVAAARQPAPARREEPLPREEVPVTEEEVRPEDVMLSDEELLEQYGHRPPSVPSEVILRQQEHARQVAESSKFYKSIGYKQYAGKYKPFEIPEGYRVKSITETETGLQVELETIGVPDEAAAYVKKTEAKPPKKTTVLPSVLPVDPWSQLREAFFKSPIGQAITGAIEGIKKKALDPRTDPTSWEVQLFKTPFEAMEGVEEFKQREFERYQRDPLGYTGRKVLEVGGLVALAVAPEVAAPAYLLGTGIQTGYTGITEQRLPTAEETLSAGLQSAAFATGSGIILKGAAAVPKVGKYLAKPVGKTLVMSGISGTTAYAFTGDVEEAAKAAVVTGLLTAGMEYLPKAAGYVKGKVKAAAAARKPKVYYETPIPTERQLITWGLEDAKRLYERRTLPWVVKAQQFELTRKPLILEGLATRQLKWEIRTVKHQLAMQNVFNVKDILTQNVPDLPKKVGEYVQPVKKPPTTFKGGKTVTSGTQQLIMQKPEVKLKPPELKTVTEPKARISAILLPKLKKPTKKKMREQPTALMGVRELQAEILKQRAAQQPKVKSAAALIIGEVPAVAQPQVPVQKVSPLYKILQPTVQLQTTKKVYPKKKRLRKPKKRRKKKGLLVAEMARRIPLGQLGIASGLDPKKMDVASHILPKRQKKRKGKR